MALPSTDRRAQSLSAGGGDAASVIWDHSVFEELAGQIGPERARGSIESFVRILAQKLEISRDLTIDFGRRRQEAHDLASMSGFLGFDALFRGSLALLSADRFSLALVDRVTAEMERAQAAAGDWLDRTPPTH